MYACLMDGCRQKLRTVEEAINGLNAVKNLIDQAEAIALTSKELLTSGQTDPNIYTQEVDISPAPLSSQIAAGNPDSYFRLNETGGAVLDSGVGPNAPVGATRQGGAIAGAAPLYNNDPQASVEFDGVNDRNKAEGLRNTSLFIKEDMLPEASDDEFYYKDLIGMTILDNSNKPFG